MASLFSLGKKVSRSFHMSPKSVLTVNVFKMAYLTYSHMPMLFYFFAILSVWTFTDSLNVTMDLYIF